MYAESIEDLVQEFFTTAGFCLARKAVPADSRDGLISGEELKKIIEPKYMPEGTFNAANFDEAPFEDAGQDLGDTLHDMYLLRRKQWGDEIADKVEREIALQTIDQNWTKQIDTMARLREGIHLRSYANTNPLQDYVNEGQSLFRECLENISSEAVFKFLNVVVQIKKPTQPAPEVSKPSEDEVTDVEAKDKEEKE